MCVGEHYVNRSIYSFCAIHSFGRNYFNSIQFNSKESDVGIDGHDDKCLKRGTYNKVLPEVKAKIAKEAIEIGNSVAARKYSKKLGVELNESTVRLWVAKYNQEMSRKRKSGEEPAIDVLPLKKEEDLY